jgi:formylglycine-generating enzyme required for sulfatase activity
MRIVPTVMVAALCAAGTASAASLKCPADAVNVGNVCVDKYEASVWFVDPTNKSLVKKVQAGKATLADLTKGGATQLSPTPSCMPAYPMTFPTNGNWAPVAGSDPPSPGVYALSIPGVLPSACISWFQAAQACALSGKRLATNQEWQRAAAGTFPFPSCRVGMGPAGPASTPTNPGCVSRWGAFDMVGNVWEWVADWGDMPDSCTHWPLPFSSNVSCIGGPGAPSSTMPGARFRGGHWAGLDGDHVNDAGAFAIAAVDPSGSNAPIGFRCVR